MHILRKVVSLEKHKHYHAEVFSADYDSLEKKRLFELFKTINHALLLFLLKGAEHNKNLIIFMMT